jgi:hypothetical protein
MNPKYVYTAAALAAVLSLATMPANAQDRRGEGRERAREHSVQGGGGDRESRGRQAAPRRSAGRQTAAAQEAPRNSQGRRYQASQDGSRSSQVRPYPGSQATPHGAGYGEQGQRAVPRAYGGYRSPAYRNDDRHGYSRPGGRYERYEARRYVRPPYFQPYRPFYFSRPYYGFRAHVHIGFGVWLGVSVPYPWAYFGAYVPRVYGYHGQGYYGVAPGVQQYGGLSFDIQPADADLFVDGEYVGSVGTFTPYGEPLTLWPGVHRIAIVREGFRTMEFDVTVQPGRVIPYRGMLARW